MIFRLSSFAAFLVITGFVVTALAIPCQAAGELSVGAASISITPDERVALDGQWGLRISGSVESPCLATAVVLETRDGDKSLDQVIFVSCDLCIIRGGEAFYQLLRERLKGQIPDECLPKIILNATHTHTGPVFEEGLYQVPESGVMGPTEYRDFLLSRLAEVVHQAWERREPAAVAWGLGHAVVAYNRRSVYANGNSVLYGKTDDPNFRGLEGTEDHGVEILYFWNRKNELIATAINVACPAQEVEGRSAVNADFWHQVREALQKQHGPQLQVLAWTGAAGDQSPHLMYRKAAEARMLKLQGIDSLQEIANRIVSTWEEVRKLVEKERHEQIELVHQVETIQLPYRRITEAQARSSLIAYEAIQDQPRTWRHDWFQNVVKRFERQKAGDPEHYAMTLHAVRIGDIGVVTNDFELYTDYGTQMKARSPALQTFVIQLCGNGTYLPTERGAAGGGYSAVPESTPVGPEGGQVLVEESVRLLQSLWTAPESRP